MSKLHDKVQKTLNQYDLDYKVIDCDPDLADTAAFCEKYNFKPEQCANTILVVSKKVEPAQYAVCVVLANARLDVNKAVCKAMGVKRASFASADQTVAQTDMMIGGVVAIGVLTHPILVDAAVMQQTEIVMGGGNRSSKLLLNPQELLKLPNLKVVEGLAKLKDN
ncbi:MAG: YbaK/EbsC family protein [Candidatus Saccharimonadales bacterium]